jgi:hypothetical protein
VEKNAWRNSMKDNATMSAKAIYTLLILSACGLIFLIASFPAAATEQVVTITMPAEMLRRTISDALPIPLETKSQYVEGNIVIDTLDRLQVNEKSIFLRGVVLGRNLAVVTNIAGQDIKMKLGSVRLPLSCELFLRFDRKKKTLFVTPRFPKPRNMNSMDPADALLPLLATLSDKEYPVELDSIQPFYARIGSRNIPIKLEPVDMQAMGGMLVFKMQPKVYKSR